MPQYCSCGAQLPPDARFCHKCGKPQFDYPGVETAPELAGEAVPPQSTAGAAVEEISFHNRTAVRTGLLAAFLAFVLLSVPLPPVFQLLWMLICCLAAGFFSTLMYRRRTHQKLSVTSGARLGWITGIFAFTIALIFSTVTVGTISSSRGGLLAQFRSQLAGKDPNMEQFLHVLENPGAMAGMLLFILVIMFFMFTLLPMVGGALCARVFDKE